MTTAEAYAMALEELTDAVAWKRAAILAPSQAAEILRVIRRDDAHERGLIGCQTPPLGVRIENA